VQGLEPDEVPALVEDAAHGKPKECPGSVRPADVRDPPAQSTMRTTAAHQGRPSSSLTSELAGEFCSQPPNWGTPCIRA
jgi:hypothetical protein